jgi:alpha-tubulin suppressor-like RCC1 family protein
VAVSRIAAKQTKDIFYEKVNPVLPKKKIHLPLRISADMHSVAVTSEGRVIAAGPNGYGECNVENWRKVCAVSAGPFFTVGLREDGRVYACGSNKYGQCNVQGWYDIAAISAGARHTVGLRRDGSVVACGQNRNGECNVEAWRNIISVSAGYMRTYGILENNKLLVSGKLRGQNNGVSHLSNIIDIKNPYPYRTLALKNDGTLSYVNKEDTTKAWIAKWKGIKQISAGPDYFAGLSKGGAVHILAYYWISSGIELSTTNWEDIAAIAAGRFHLLGVKKDGSVIAAMMHPNREMNKGQCRVTNWQLLD